MASEMRMLLDAQKAAQLRDGPPSAEIRIDRIDRCIALLVDHRAGIEAALNTDFGSRSAEASAFTDVASSIGTLKEAKKSLKAWMKPEKRKTTPAILASIRRQGGGALPAQGRDRNHLAVEFSGEPHLHAARRRPGGGKPGDDQAVGIHPRDLGPDGGDVRQGVFAGGDRGRSPADRKPVRSSPDCRSTTSSSPAPRRSPSTSCAPPRRT